MVRVKARQLVFKPKTMFAIEKYKFCPSCKTSFEKKGEKLLVCPKCDLNYYINPVPCNVVILFNKKHEVLLVRRGVDPFKGTWTIPGGFIEPNETLEESICREVKEELNIVPNKITYFRSYPDTYLFKEVVHHTLVFVFTGEVSSGTAIKAKDDISEFKFVALKDVPLKEFAFQSVKKPFIELQSLYA